MKRLILVLALIAVCLFSFGQDDKAAAKAQKRIERAERRRVRDSLATEKTRLYWREVHIKDSIRQEERRKEGATTIQVLSPISPAETLDRIARTLIKYGYVIHVDKEYGTINTELKWGNGASYTLHFVIEEHSDGCKATGFAYAHGQVTAFSTHLGIGINNDIHMRMEYGGFENSTCMIAFQDLSRCLTILPQPRISYHKDNDDTL